MSEFFIDGYRVATEAELAALERANAAGDLDCGVLIAGMVAELRALRADAATHALVVKELQAKIRARLSRPSLLVEPEGIHAGRFFTWLCDACAPPLGPLEFIPDVGGNAPACAVCDAPKPQRPCTAEQLTRALRTQREHLALWDAGLAPGVLCTCGHLNSEHKRGPDAPTVNGRWFDCSQCTCLVLKVRP